MKIILIGGNGTIGKRVNTELSKRYEVITAGRNSGDIKLDISDPESIKAMFENTSGIDAVVCAGGGAGWGPLSEMNTEKFQVGISNKLMGQVNLVLIGQHYLKKGASVTLISGILADEPVNGSSNASMVNGGLHSFVKSSAREIDNGIRVNVVSPELVKDSEEKLGGAFPGHTAVTMDRVVNGFLRSVEGQLTGEVIRVY